MRTFKLTDAFISLGLILFCCGYCLADGGSIERIVTSYFIIGGWQTISMIVHALKKGYVKKNSYRSTYHWITLISLVTLPFGAFYILLFIAPLMAIFYTGLCLQECFGKPKRPLSFLK